jgi:hypothetical protein
MLEILFVTVVMIGGLWAAVCIIDYAHKLRMKEIDRFLRKYEQLHTEAERQRSAKEMAATIMIVERECKRKQK